MTRWELYSDYGDLDMAAGRNAIKTAHGTNVREAYRDMGTWWGTNQPRVLAFSVNTSAEAERAALFYRTFAPGKRADVETRRT
jgi:hypothetical protein